MNHIKSSCGTMFPITRSFAIRFGLWVTLVILFCHNVNAFNYRWADYSPLGGPLRSDAIDPNFFVTLGEGAEPLPAGEYRIYIRRNGQANGYVKFTINLDRSVTTPTRHDGAASAYAPHHDHTLLIQADENLYNSTASRIVGSVSGGGGYSWHEVPPFYPHDFKMYYLQIELTVSSQCPDQTKLAGRSEGKLGSLRYDIGLGMGTQAKGTGKLSLYTEVLHPYLATHTSLLLYSTADFEQIESGGSLKQVLSGQLLADIVVSNSYQYDVRLYRASDAGVLTNGFYVPTNSPVKVITFLNPDGSTNYNRLWITEIEGNATNQYKYTYLTNSTGSSNTWELLYPANLRKEVLTTTWSTTNTERAVLFSAYAPGTPDVLVYEERKRFKDWGWGERLIEQVIDPNGTRLTNTWEYYTNSSAVGDCPRLKSRTEWNGFWEEYDYDTQGRETNRLTVFLNATNAAPPDQCRQLITSYSSSSPHVTKIEKLLGHEIGRTYLVWNSGSNAVQTIRCQTPGALWTASDNLSMTSTRDNSYNRPTNIWHVDGTRTFYSFVTNGDYSVVTTMTQGKPNSDGKSLNEGIKKVTKVGPYGEMISNIVINVVGSTDGIILERDSYSYASDDYSRVSPTITHLDGTQTSGSSGCCGAPNFGNAVSKDGTTISFVFDALERRVSSTVNGITTSNIFDALGNELVSIRIGTDSSVITLHQASYDVAGRLRSETNALNGVTTYTNTIGAAGQLIKTNTYADGGTRIETYFRDGSLESVTGTAVLPLRYEYSVENDGSGVTNFFSKETRLGSGSETNEWTKTFRDMIGRSYKTVYTNGVGSPFSISYFNSVGQITNQIDPDGVSILYVYNPKGELAYTVLDSNRDHTISYSGSDRIAYVTNDIVNNGSDVRRTRTYVWDTSADSSKLVSTVESAVDGLRSWTTIWNNGTAVTSQARIVYDAASGHRYVTNTAPDGSYTVATTRYGTNVSLLQYDSLNNPLTTTTYAYDAHGRQNRITDARNGTSTNYFNNAGQVSGIKTPAPASGQSSQVATNYFDNLGQVWKTTLTDDTSVTNEFYLTGLLKKTSGSRTYPVEFTYDYAGRMKTMQTWTNYPNNNSTTTTWNYDAYRGFLTGKAYNGGASGPSYTYTDAGRLLTRTWARGVSATYSYNNAGDLQSIAYSGSTPGLTYTYTRRGQPHTVTQGASVCTYAYNDAGQLLSDSTAGGVLDGLSVTNGFDSVLRRTNLVLNSASTRLASTTYGYDDASRFKRISDGTNSATYSYLTDSLLVSQIAFSNNTALRMTTAKSYDLLNRLTNITSTPSGASAVSFKYGHNSANQRTSVTNADSTQWSYSYDSLGQVISGKKYWSDGTPVAGQQFEYEFDTIGNRKTTKAGGDASGASLRTNNYFVDGLNQYISRTVPGALDVLGSASSGATVTVNNQATYRKGDYYRKELTLDNSTDSVWAGVTNVAVVNDGTDPDIVTITTGNAFLPETPEAFLYDADGNLTNDGRWVFMWDAENRLTNMTSLSSSPSGSKLKLDFTYDYWGRRTQKIVSAWDGTNYVAQSTNKFIYEGWNLIAELSASSTLIRSYFWGLDLSGSLDGAGGVGGLLTVNDTTNATHFVSFDGNGNVAALVKASDGTVSANYEYGPFGELVRVTGVMASANPFRFSTKYQDETDLLYYGFRYYSPNTGRWLNRDSIEELGGLNLYAFTFNGPTLYFDSNGQFTIGEWGQIYGEYWVGLGIGAVNVGKAIGSIPKTLWQHSGPYYLAVKLPEQARILGTWSTQPGRDELQQRLELAKLLAETYANDACFRANVNAMLGREAKDYFTDPYRMSELLAHVGVLSATAGFGQWAKTAEGSERLAQLAKLLEAVLQKSAAKTGAKVVTQPGAKGSFTASELGNAIANDPVASRAYRILQEQGVNVTLYRAADNLYGTAGNGTVRINLEYNATVDDALSTLVHEAKHIDLQVNSGHLYGLRGTQSGEYAARALEFYRRTGRRPSAAERAAIQQLIRDLGY